MIVARPEKIVLLVARYPYDRLKRSLDHWESSLATDFALVSAGQSPHSGVSRSVALSDIEPARRLVERMTSSVSRRQWGVVKRHPCVAPAHRITPAKPPNPA